MPTNLTPGYRKAEEAFRRASNHDDKIARLEEMIACLPRHKGTDHLYADLRHKLSKLRAQIESSGHRSAGPTIGFSREGAAQLVLVGPPSCGKSSILAALSNARPEIGEYPFTTTQMQPGMIGYEDIKMQLVDSPPVTPEYLPPHLLGLVRGADAALVVADLASDSLLEDLESVLGALLAQGVRLVAQRSAAAGKEVRCRLLANKRDAPGAAERFQLLQEMLGTLPGPVQAEGPATAAPAGERDDPWTCARGLEILPLSCREPDSIGALPKILFDWLEIVRVYTKAPGERPELERPYTVFAGQTVADICALIHKDFAENLRFARLWRDSPNPTTVSPREPVIDRDILELHL
jgi:ribosome-interacting GTPase 1